MARGKEIKNWEEGGFPMRLWKLELMSEQQFVASFHTKSVSVGADENGI